MKMNAATSTRKLKIFRAHRKAKRQAKQKEKGHEGRGEALLPKNYMEEDAELKALHDSLHDAGTRDERKAIRKQIRERLTTLRAADRDTPDAVKFGDGMRRHGPVDSGPESILSADRHERRRGRDVRAPEAPE